MVDTKAFVSVDATYSIQVQNFGAGRLILVENFWNLAGRALTEKSRQVNTRIDHKLASSQTRQINQNTGFCTTNPQFKF